MNRARSQLLGLSGFVFLTSLAALVGCGTKSDVTPAATDATAPVANAEPGKAAVVPGADEILRQIDEALEYTFDNRRLSVGASENDQAAWQIVHGALAFKREFVVNDGGRDVSAVDYILRGGKMKAFAVMTPTRWPAMPDVPTTDEIGMPGTHISFWHGLWVPKGTPKPVISKLNGAIVDALADAAVRQRLTDLGQVIATREQQNPAALAGYHKAEIDKWWPIIKAANIKVEAN